MKATRGPKTNGSIRLGEQMMKKVAFLGSAALMSLALNAPAAAQFSAALDESKAAIREGARSQQRVEELDEDTRELVSQYGGLLRQRDSLRRFNASRTREVENQVRTISGLEQDVENVQGLQRAVLPLLEEMVAELERVVAADIPFLQTEREERLERLRRVMADSTQTAASRYNLIMEAYQIENEYGRTIDSYKDTVISDGEELTVDFLRIGRLALMYKNADDTVLRIYNKDTKSFDDLDMSYLSAVRTGIRIANEQLPPDLMTIPVPAPQSAAQ